MCVLITTLETDTDAKHTYKWQQSMERVFVRPLEFSLISPLLRRWTIDWPNFVPKHCTKTTTKINSIWTTGPTNWSCFLHLLMILYAFRMRNTCEVTIHATAVSTSVAKSAFFQSNIAFFQSSSPEHSLKIALSSFFNTEGAVGIALTLKMPNLMGK